MADCGNPTLDRLRTALQSDDELTFSPALLDTLREATAEQLISFSGAARVDELAQRGKCREALVEALLAVVFRHG